MKNPTDSRASRSRRLHGLVALLLAPLTLALLLGCGQLGPEGGASDEAPDESAKPSDDRVAVVIEGREISISELETYMKDAFLEELMRQPEARIYEAREKGIRELVQKTVVEREAAARGVDPDTLFEQVVAEAPEPTDEDVEAWYRENQSRLRGAELSSVSAQIKELLANERRTQAWSDFIGPRIEALDFQFVLEPPRQDLEATRLVRGPTDAPVTIMTFSDYQCPYCIRSEPVLAEVLSRYPEQVRLVHRHFPLETIHPFARPAAEAAMCADEQGRFWEYHDAIFARQGRLEEGSFAEIGDELGLDGEALDLCIQERRYAAFVDEDFAAGRAAGVTGTPAFFVNGIALKGARDADELSRVVDSELARARMN